MALDISTARSDIAKVYIATFNRVPDSAGLDFWVSAYLNGSSLASIANGFASSAEYAAKYPSFLTNEEYVASIYTNVFGRKVDDDGRDFWVGALDAGTVTKAGLLNSLVAAANANGSTDGAKLTNEASFGVYCATNNIQWTNAAAALATITSDTATVTAAQTAANLAESTLTITSANAVLTAFTNTNITPSATYLTTTNNIITAGINLSGANITDASTTDSDTLTASLNGAGLTTAPTITNIETINFTTNATGATSLLGVTGATAINVSGGAAMFDNAQTQPFKLASGYAAGLTANVTTATVGSHQGINVTLNGTSTGAGVTTNSTSTTTPAIALAVAANSTLSTLDTAAGTATINVSGAGNLIVADATTTGTVNASSMTGTLTFNDVNATIITGSSQADSFTQATAAANASVNGGAGNDSFVFSTLLATGDIVDGGTGTDSISFTDAGSVATDLDNVTNIETVTLGNAATAVTTVDALVAFGQTLTVDGSALTNALTWNGAAETNGVFSVTGGTVADVITGGAHADTITGGNGADSITGGGGVDNITGGSGADTFVFANTATGTPSATNFDSITDYTSNSDIIDFGSTAIAQGGDTHATTGIAVAGHAAVAAGVVSFHADDDTLAKRIIAVNDALDDTANDGGTTDASAGESLVFDFGADSYIFISDGVLGIGATDVLIKLVGIDGAAGTDSLTISGGDIAALV